MSSTTCDHLGGKGAYLKQKMRDKLIEHKHFIDEHGEDLPEIRNWKWSPRALAETRPRFLEAVGIDGHVVFRVSLIATKDAQSNTQPRSRARAPPRRKDR